MSDFVYAYAKRGDILSSDAKQSLLDGFIIEVIDPDDEGWQKSIRAEQKRLGKTIISTNEETGFQERVALTPAEMENMLFPDTGKMKRAYSIIRARRGTQLHTRLKNATVPTVEDEKSVDYRPKSGYIDYHALEAVMNAPGLEGNIHSPNLHAILDGDKIPLGAIQNTTDPGAVVKDARNKSTDGIIITDFNAITSGSYTIGTAGNYATMTAFFADIANLTGAMNGTVVSSYTTTAAALSTINQGGFALTITNHASGSHNGNMVDGHIGSINSGSDAAIDVQTTNGSFVASGLSFKRITTAPAAGRAFLWMRGTSMVYQISGCVFNGNGLVNVRSVLIGSGTGANSYVINCLANFSNYAIDIAVAGVTVENVTLVHASASYGFYCTGSAAVIFRNNVAIGYTAGFGFISNSTGRNNATSDATCTNANWAAGSGNQPNIVAANCFISTDATTRACGKLRNQGVCWNGGTAPTFAGATDLAGRARPNNGGVYAIGAFEYNAAHFVNGTTVAPTAWVSDDTNVTKDAQNRVSSWLGRGAYGHSFTQGTDDKKPVLQNKGLYFDGSNDFLGGPLGSAFLNAAASTMAIVFEAESIAGTSGTPFANDQIFGDGSLGACYWGFMVRNTPVLYWFNWDGNADKTEHAIALNRRGLFVAKHSSGSIYNKDIVTGQELSALSGNTGSLAGNAWIGGRNGAIYFKGWVREIVVFNEVLSAGDQALVESYLTAKYVPNITGVAPATGPIAGGNAVVISGTAFGAVQGTGSVTIGGNAATVTAWGDTQITVTVPAHAVGAVDVVVTTGSALVDTAAGAYTYDAVPSVSSITPAIGNIRGEITALIVGSSFNALQGSGGVIIGGIAATVLVWSDTEISVTVPPHAAGASDVVVTDIYGQSGTLAGGFVYQNNKKTYSKIYQF